MVWYCIMNISNCKKYVYVRIVEDGKIRYKIEHRLVWESAYGKIPNGYIIIHKNGDTRDNRLDNLEMVEKRLFLAKLHTERAGNKWSGKLKTRDDRIAWQRDYYRRNRERLIKASARRQLKNPEAVREYQREWRKRNPDKVKAYHKSAYAKVRASKKGEVKC